MWLLRLTNIIVFVYYCYSGPLKKQTLREIAYLKPHKMDEETKYSKN